MSGTYINRPGSFGDDQAFDVNSTPEVEFTPDPVVEQPIIQAQVVTAPVVTIAPEMVVTRNVYQPELVGPVIGPACQVYSPPWPSIIIGILGAIVVIYTAVAPKVSTDRRLFGVVLMTLWTIVWALILWVLWKECHRSASWWLLLIAVIIMAIFFILIIIMNIGA